MQAQDSFLTRQLLFPGVRLDRWLIAAFAVLMMAFGYALVFAPEATLQFLMDSRNELKPPLPPFVLTCARLFGGLLSILGLPLLLLSPVEDREIRKRIAFGLFLPATLFALLLQPFDPPMAGGLVVLLWLGPMLLATPLIGPFIAGSLWRPYEDTRREWREQIQQAATQQERNRLARDLHDSIKQQLFSIRVASAAVEARWDQDPQGARDALGHVRKSAHEATVEMQALLLQLRPEALATVGLVEALREQCESLGYRTGAAVVLEVGDLPADSRWPVGSQEALFRIAQEAMANVARHARAAKVLVRLAQSSSLEDGALVLEVRDDGQGFESSRSNSGMGTRNMMERLQSFGGALEIESARAQGTNLTARLPIALQNASAHLAPAKKVDLINAWLNPEQLGIFAALVAIAFVFTPANRWLAESMSGLLLILGFFSSLNALRPRQDARRVQPHVLNRLLTYTVAFYLNPLITTGARSWINWAIAILSLGLGFYEAAGFVRRRRARSSEAPKSYDALFAALFAGLVIAPIVPVLAKSPRLVVHMSLMALSLPFIVWWLREQLTEEPK